VLALPNQEALLERICVIHDPCANFRVPSSLQVEPLEGVTLHPGFRIVTVTKAIWWPVP